MRALSDTAGRRTAAIVCSGRELFGSDRSALELARVLTNVGVSAHLEAVLAL